MIDFKLSFFLYIFAFVKCLTTLVELGTSLPYINSSLLNLRC
jgi:hypothetical protein